MALEDNPTPAAPASTPSVPPAAPKAAAPEAPAPAPAARDNVYDHPSENHSLVGDTIVK